MEIANVLYYLDHSVLTEKQKATAFPPCAKESKSQIDELTFYNCIGKGK